tara:strand:+ start:562 stop:792 length:231 start_codon:yes stop_codon:yes gene_type:complete
MSDSKKKASPKKAVAKKKEEVPKTPVKFKTPEEFYKAKKELKDKHLKATPNLWQLPQSDPARAKYEAEKNALKALR